MDQMKYELGFRKGLQDSRFADSIEEINIPEVDNSSFESIGYADGIDYGIYLIRAGMKYAIKEENLIAVINKGFLRACERVEGTKEKKYI